MEEPYDCYLMLGIDLGSWHSASSGDHSCAQQAGFHNVLMLMASRRASSALPDPARVGVNAPAAWAVVQPLYPPMAMPTDAMIDGMIDQRIGHMPNVCAGAACMATLNSLRPFRPKALYELGWVGMQARASPVCLAAGCIPAAHSDSAIPNAGILHVHMRLAACGAPLGSRVATSLTGDCPSSSARRTCQGTCTLAGALLEVSGAGRQESRRRL